MLTFISLFIFIQTKHQKRSTIFSNKKNAGTFFFIGRVVQTPPNIRGSLEVVQHFVQYNQAEQSSRKYGKLVKIVPCYAQYPRAQRNPMNSMLRRYARSALLQTQYIVLDVKAHSTSKTFPPQ
jgi:hypothetical protein